MTYYLKYRPKTLDELDITSVRESLIKIVSSGNIPHAFLFTGPKGIGKTSAARILAAIVNCESTTRPKNLKPCNKCDSCISIANGSNIDVIELDAASHRGIDDVRNLRDAVKLSPAKARKKVYIIDEAHMLTTEASNALLKTLEEPPGHVMFILATTNLEKLIETIRSRTIIINFNKADNNEIKRSLVKIVKGEKLKIENKALDLIAEKSEGSFRDASKILEQIVSEKISQSYKDIEKYLSQALPSNTSQLLEYILAEKLDAALSEVARLVKKGSTAEFIIQKIIENLRRGLLAKVGLGEDIYPDIAKDKLIYLIELLMRANKNIRTSYIEELPLEIAIIKYCDVKNSNLKKDPATEEVNNLPAGSKKIETKTKVLSEIHQKVSLESKIIGGEIKEISNDIWNKILSQVRPINMSVEALLRAAKPVKFDGKTLTLGVYYRFHKERLEDIRNRQILERVVEQVISIPAKVVCILTEAPPKKVIPENESDVVLTESEEDDVVKAAKEIFGS